MRATDVTPDTRAEEVLRAVVSQFFYKEGGGGGFHCLMRLYPAPGIGTVVMTNATACDVRRLLDAADSQFLGVQQVSRCH
jgi:hypothetical protein